MPTWAGMVGLGPSPQSECGCHRAALGGGSMSFKAAASVTVAALLTVLVHAEGQQKPTVAIPQPGVPQIMTIEGTYVRAAYNNEGYVILGYQIANESVGEEWVLLEIGATLRSGKPAY